MQTSLSFELYEMQETVKKNKEVFYIDFDFVDPSLLMNDVEKFMYSTVHEYLKNMALLDAKENNPNRVGRQVSIHTDVLGIPMQYADKLTAEYGKETQKKAYDMGSLKNDITYSISIMQSGNTETTVQALNRVRYESMKWTYHILNKHFDEPIPEGYEPDNPVDSEPLK